MTSTKNLPAARGEGGIAEMIQWSQAMAAGDLLPAQYRRKPANLMFAAEYADALGISRIHVLTSIAVINGRPSPSADLMAAMVRKAGHRLRVTGDDSHAVAELIRADDPEFVFRAEWDMGKARQAGLLDKSGPWRLYPAAMLKARAISEVVRMGAQEVMAGGIYTPEELGARVDADGAVTASPVRAEAARRHPDSDTPAETPAPRPAEEIAKELDDPGLTVSRARELWREARACGDQDLMDLVAETARSIEAGGKQTAEPEADAAQEEPLEAAIVEDSAA